MSITSTLISRAREIAPLVAAEAENTDRNGAISDKVIDAFCEAQLLEILVPKRFGGHELNYETMARVVYEIAPHCTSTAWVLSFYIGHNFIHSLFPEKSQEEVFANRPYALTPGTVAPNFSLTPVDGGYIANGRSSWNSGSSRCDWFLNNGLIKVEGQLPTMRCFFVRAKDANIIDNWNVAGMKGTSSGDIELKDVFVPEYHTTETLGLLGGTSPGSLIHKAPIYSMPLLPFVLGEVMPVVVGAYRGAANDFKKLTEERFTTFTSAKVLSKQTAQMRIGHGQTGAALAEAMLENYIAEIDRTDVDRFKPLEARAATKSKVSMVTDFCSSGINYLFKGAGAGAWRNESSLQRFFRDLNMLTVHGFLDLEVATETYGRILVGLPPESPL